MVAVAMRAGCVSCTKACATGRRRKSGSCVCTCHQGTRWWQWRGRHFSTCMSGRCQHQGAAKASIWVQGPQQKQEEAGRGHGCVCQEEPTQVFGLQGLQDASGTGASNQQTTAPLDTQLECARSARVENQVPGEDVGAEVWRGTNTHLCLGTALPRTRWLA